MSVSSNGSKTSSTCRPSALFCLLQRAMASLEQEGVVSTGGVRVRQRSDRRRECLLELSA